MRERGICALPCSLNPLYHTLGINTITWFLPIPSGDHKSPEEEEDGSLLICLAVLLSHEGPDGIQKAGMQLFSLIKDEQGLPAALQGLAELPLQLGLHSRGEECQEPLG